MIRWQRGGKRALMLAVLCTFGSELMGAQSGAEQTKLAAKVTEERVGTYATPEGGIQPQAVVDSKGQTHVVYFKGNAAGGDLYYTRLTPGGSSRSANSLRVNSQPGSAGAIGTVRAAQIALGKNDRVHIVWNGLGPKSPNGYPVAYQAYARMNDAGTAFELQRNLTTWAKGLDGGGTVAADKTGNVYVFWHALADAKDKSGRTVFLSHSSDEGKTFAREVRANSEPTGACACCGMKAFADSNGVVYVLYRAAGANINRDTMLLVSQDKGKTFQEKRLDRWKINACPMSTYALTENAGQIWAAWETEGHIFSSYINPATFAVSTPQSVPGDKQKHPFLAPGRNGQTLLAWTEGTGWQQGGSLVFRVIYKDGTMSGADKVANVVPVWGLPTAFASQDGFLVMH